jgi:hypothetical protein
MATFKVTVMLHARMVEKWTWDVKRDFLDAAATKCVGLGCDFTAPRNHKVDEKQRATVLQLSVASETLVFQMIHANIKVSHVLNDISEDGNIKVGSAAIENDVRKLELDGIHITCAYDLQKIVPNPTREPTPSLHDLANHTIGTNLEQKKKKYDGKKKRDASAQEKEDELIFRWGNYPLGYEQVHYAALDAHPSFEIARKY